MFMEVALACMGPRFPRWVFTFDATDEERAEALAAFGEPYNVVGTAQIQIGREMEPITAKNAFHWRRQWVYTASVVSWECAPIRASTIAGLVEANPRWKP